MKITPFTIFDMVQPHFRQKRMRQFIETLQPAADTKNLDVGGYPGFWASSGLKCQITVLNTHEFDVPDALRDQITPLLADGCNLPSGVCTWLNHPLDVVFDQNSISSSAFGLSLEAPPTMSRPLTGAASTDC